MTAARPASRRGMKLLLDSIGADAHAQAAVLSADGAVSLLRECAGEWPETTATTWYTGGKQDTRWGVEKILAWQDFAELLADCGYDVGPKGTGWWFTPAISTNGRCRDQDIAAITQLALDADGAGDWETILERLDAAGIAWVAQRSSSHTIERPKWHLHLPLLTPWTGSKTEWRMVYRHFVAWFSGVANLDFDLAASAPRYGFDAATDRLGQPWFPSARRTESADVPETVWRRGTALNLGRLLSITGFDASLGPPPPQHRIPRPRRIVPRTIASKEIAPASGGEGLLVRAFDAAGLLGPDVGGGKRSVRCPWEHEHTGGRPFDGSTVLFPPAGGRTLGWFHCSHAHCDGRGPREALLALPNAAHRGTMLPAPRKVPRTIAWRAERKTS